MAEDPKIDSIAVRKRLLTAKSDVYRATLQLRLHEVQEPFRSIREWQSGRPQWPVAIALFAAPIAGYLAVKRGWSLQRALTQGVGLWQILRQTGLLDLLQKRPAKDEPANH